MGDMMTTCNKKCPICMHSMDDHIMNKIAYQCWVETDVDVCCGCTHELDEPSILFYVLRDKTGTYYKNSKNSFYPKNGWVAKIEDAKFFVKLGQARGQVTRLGKDLDIVVFKATEVRVLDEKARVDAVNKAKKLAAEKRLVAEKARKIREAREAFEKAKSNLEKLTTSVNPTRCSECGHDAHQGWNCSAESFNGYLCCCKTR